MNKRIIRYLSLAALLLAVGVALAQSTVDWWVIAGGGGPSSGGNVELNATLGQPIVGPASHRDVSLGAGYWYGTASLTLEQHTLTLATDGNGSGAITATPNQSLYDYGTVVTLTASADTGSFFAGWSGDLNGSTNPATITITADTRITATFTLSGTDYFIFLPIVTNNYVSAPDLVVDELTVSDDSIEVTITNQGDTAVTDAFWVDVYINPGTPPTAVNQTIDTLNCEGVVWGVTDSALPLLPGDSLVLTLDDAYFAEGHSRLSLPVAVGTAVYAQVDSANTNTTYGNVLENHESNGGVYNNIAQMTVTTAVSLSVPVPSETDLPRLEMLPQR